MGSQDQSEGRKDAMSDGALLPFGKSSPGGLTFTTSAELERKGVAMPPETLIAASSARRPRRPWLSPPNGLT